MVGAARALVAALSRSLVVAASVGSLVACGDQSDGLASGRDAGTPDGSSPPFDASSGGSAGSGGTSPTDASADAPGVDAFAEAAVDHSDQLPAGVTPPKLWFWRGIHQGNLGNWRTDDQGRRCADGDTTMWFRSPGNAACPGGAPACDPDHFGTQAAPCTGVDCSWRNWDDPRGPEFRVKNATGPVEVHNFGAKSASGGKLPDYGFGVTVCAPPGTVADIDTCPRSDLYSCVEDNYPQLVDQCTTVLLQIDPPKQSVAGAEGCFSAIDSVTITF